jgi:signal transduction histidine kinase
VDDDGAGFDASSASSEPTGFGLVGMRERAEQIGARLTITSRPGQGTRVWVVAPLAPEEPEGPAPGEKAS